MAALACVITGGVSSRCHAGAQSSRVAAAPQPKAAKKKNVSAAKTSDGSKSGGAVQVVLLSRVGLQAGPHDDNSPDVPDENGCVVIPTIVGAEAPKCSGDGSPCGGGCEICKAKESWAKNCDAWTRKSASNMNDKLYLWAKWSQNGAKTVPICAKNT